MIEVATGSLSRPYHYAGIGSRRTPDDVLEFMERTARGLAQAGWELRSGGARGADKAFERGAGAKPKQIFRPTDDPKAAEIARDHHLAWGLCSPDAQALLARNAFVILGPELNDPVRFVLCWTDDPPNRGGTNHACRIARAHGVPVINLHDGGASYG